MQGAVPPELRATAFAMTTFIESGFAAVAGILAGTLADRLGLTRAMLWMIPFPWLICGLLFSGFYWAYPRDAAKLRQQMADRARAIADMAGEGAAQNRPSSELACVPSGLGSE